MTPSIPTYRPVVTPSRLAWLIAVTALGGNFYLVLDDALAAGTNLPVTAVATAAACVERGDHP